MARWVVLAAWLAACGDVSISENPRPGDADDPHTAGDDVDTGPTWHRDVAPLLAEHCGGCHRDGSVAPFAVDDYATVKSWGPAIADAVASGRMPPFAATETSECTTHVPYAEDVRLTEDEKATIATWIESGAPEGDAASAAPVEVPQPDALTDPDAIVSLPKPYTVSGTEDHYVCFRVPVPIDQDVYLTGLQVLPDNDLVVHHVLVWADPDDQSKDRVDADGKYECSGTPDFFPTQIVGTWTPGSGARRTPAGTGTPLKQGGVLVVNVHYHPTGTTDEVDRSQVALEWTTEKPDHFATWFLVDLPFGSQSEPDPLDDTPDDFRIPANASRHVEKHLLDTGPYLPIPLQIFAVGPHMHYLGREMLVTLKHDDADECLVHAPTYRFDWQTTYYYDADLEHLPTLMPGDKVEVRCTYDNSSSNPFLPAALAASRRSEPGDVWWGEETGDEMCMAMVGFVMPPIDLDEIFDLIGL
jgi:hypothetical protein